MSIEEIIQGLQDLIVDRESFITEKDSIFAQDKQVLEEAIKLIQEQSKKINEMTSKILMLDRLRGSKIYDEARMWNTEEVIYEERMDKNMKIMISQPMRGKTQEEIETERAGLVKELEDKGYEVINTIFTQDAPENVNAGVWYLAKSIEAMSKADAVIFMQGWEKARGCKIEHEIALKYNKFIKEIE